MDASRVLYLDDDESIVLLMAMLLERRGVRVAGFDNTHAALAALRAEPGAYPIVVTDHELPGRSGLDVAREVRSLDPAIRVVLVSGYVDEALQTRAAQAGIARLLLKPATAHEMAESIAGFVADCGCDAQAGE